MKNTKREHEIVNTLDKKRIIILLISKKVIKREKLN